MPYLSFNAPSITALMTWDPNVFVDCGCVLVQISHHSGTHPRIFSKFLPAVLVHIITRAAFGEPILEYWSEEQTHSYEVSHCCESYWWKHIKIFKSIITM